MKISDFADLELEQIPLADTEDADAKIKEYYISLSPARKEKADAIKSRSSRRQSICAGHLLEDMLRAKGLSAPFSYGMSEKGKPFLEGVQFSLSHCKGWCACIVADQMVGVDVEMLGRYRDSLCRRFFTKEENVFLEKVTDVDFYFTLLWTGKEALAKCLDAPLDEVCRDCNMQPLLQALEEKPKDQETRKLGGLTYGRYDIYFETICLKDAVVTYCLCQEEKRERK